ncbi:DUF6709 family protein [Eubacterium ruminantium]|uniref:DUF6709 family protein n=1 Tax=Eubacterium ruminantium TaxID=42322 RepID=UPI00087F0DAD|nr:DUF6709 family protein [Eubacterium ruminantium]SDM81080.1 hypothetical protein SAMN04490370_106155 [Eubacterium ruminantium]
MDTLKKELFKKSRSERIKLGIILVVIGLPFFLIGFRMLIGCQLASKELTKCKANQVSTGYYKYTDIYGVLGTYGESSVGSRTVGTGYVMCIYPEGDMEHLDESQNDWYLMGIFFDESDSKVAEKLYNGLNSGDYQYISGSGRVRKMKSDEKYYFKKACLEAYGEEIEDHLVYKTLEYKTFPRMMGGKDWIMGLMGLALFVGGVIFIVTMNGGRKEATNKILASGINPVQFTKDFQSGTKIGKLITITDDAVVIQGISPKVFFFKNLVWVYPKITTTQNKTYGIKTSQTKTYQVIFTERNKKATPVTVNYVEQGKLVEIVHEKAPYIITGYNYDIATAVQNDFGGIINAVDNKKAELLQKQNEPVEISYFDHNVDKSVASTEPTQEKLQFGQDNVSESPAASVPEKIAFGRTDFNTDNNVSSDYPESNYGLGGNGFSSPADEFAGNNLGGSDLGSNEFGGSDLGSNEFTGNDLGGNTFGGNDLGSLGEGLGGNSADIYKNSLNGSNISSQGLNGGELGGESLGGGYGSGMSDSLSGESLSGGLGGGYGSSMSDSLSGESLSGGSLGGGYGSSSSDSLSGGSLGGGYGSSSSDSLGGGSLGGGYGSSSSDSLGGGSLGGGYGSSSSDSLGGGLSGGYGSSISDSLGGGSLGGGYGSSLSDSLSGGSLGGSSDLGSNSLSDAGFGNTVDYSDMPKFED